MPKKTKKTRWLSWLLAALIAAEPLLAQIVLFPGAVSADAVANAEGYANPYVTESTSSVTNPTRPTSVTGSGDIAGMLGSGGSYIIKDYADLQTLATFSQNNRTDGKTFTITPQDSQFITLDANFIGIGSADYPFSGTLNYIYNNSNIILNMNGSRTLFNYLSSSATVTCIEVNAGALAAHYVLAETVTPLSSIYLTGSLSGSYENESCGLLFGSVSGTSASALNLSGVTINNVSLTASDANAGWLIGSLENDANLVIGSLSVPASVQVTAVGGDAGLLVGHMGERSSLTVSGVSFADRTVHVTSTGGDAGLLAGVMESEAALTVNTFTFTGNASAENVTAIRLVSGTTDQGGSAGLLVGNMASGTTLAGSYTLNNAMVGGGKTAGALVGYATDATLPADNVTVSGCTVQGGECVGGYVGSAENPKAFSPGSHFSVSSTIIPTNDIRFGFVGAGGLFGRVQLTGTAAVTTALDLSSLSTAVSSILSDPTGTASDKEVAKDKVCIGGLVGVYTANRLDSALRVTGKGSTTVVSLAYPTGDMAVHAQGGAIGQMAANSYCKITSFSSGFTSSVSAPLTEDFTSRRARILGGMTGYVSEGAVLDLDTVTVKGGFSTLCETGRMDSYAGGLVGYIGMGAALRMSGTVTLGNQAYGYMGVTFAQYSGQLVGYQDSALIFAESGWSLTRNSNATTQGMDDIGNYGQVFRNGNTKISNVIVFNAVTHAISIAAIGTASSSAITLSSEKEYAALAITLNTRGCFSAVSSITHTNYSTLLGADITISNNINLTGTGVECLTRNDDNTDKFSGSVVGTNGDDVYTVTLAIGETSFSGGTHGNGEIYGHVYLGMFGSLSGASPVPCPVRKSPISKLPERSPWVRLLTL